MHVDVAHLTAFQARHSRQDGWSPQAGGARRSQASQRGRAQMLQECSLSCSQRSEPLLAQLGSLLVLSRAIHNPTVILLNVFRMVKTGM